MNVQAAACISGRARSDATIVRPAPALIVGGALVWQNADNYRRRIFGSTRT